MKKNVSSKAAVLDTVAAALELGFTPITVERSPNSRFVVRANPPRDDPDVPAGPDVEPQPRNRPQEA